MTRRRIAAVLLGVVAAGGALRFAGLDFGFPLRLRPDETLIHEAVEDLARRDDWNPRFFAYPGLALYLPLGVLHAAHATERLWNPGAAGRPFQDFVADRVASIRVLRAVSALAGALTLLVAFRLGRKAGGPATGLAAAALLAVSFLHVRDSHFGTSDVVTALAAALAASAMLEASASGKLHWFALTGLWIGVAAALKYLPAVLIAPAGLAAFHASRARPEGARIRPFLAAWLVTASVAALAFLALAPYTLLAFGEFWQGFASQSRISLQSGPTPFATGRRLLSAGLPVAVGLPAALAALAGAIVGLRRPPVAGLAVAIVAYLALLACIPRTFIRYLLPVVPLVCVLAGLFCVEIASRLFPRRPALAAAALVAALGVEPLWRSVAIDRLFAGRTTEQELLSVLEAQPVRPILCAPAAHSLGTDAYFRMAPIDPLRWPKEGDVMIVLARHPHPNVGDEWSAFRRAIESSPSAEKLLEVRAFADFETSGARFEENDWFLFPVSGFAGVERGGPDLVLYRVHRPPRASPPACGAPAASVEPSSGGRRRIRIAPAAGAACQPVAYYARMRTGPDGDGWTEPILRPVAPGGVPVPDNLPPGRYHVSFAVATLDGLSEWSAPLVVDLP